MKKAVFVIILCLSWSSLFSKNFCVITFSEKNLISKEVFDYCWIVEVTDSTDFNNAVISPLFLDCYGISDSTQVHRYFNNIQREFTVWEYSYDNLLPAKIIKDNRHQIGQFKYNVKNSAREFRKIGVSVKIYLTPIKGEVRKTELRDYPDGHAYSVACLGPNSDIQLWDDFYDTPYATEIHDLFYFRVPYDLMNWGHPILDSYESLVNYEQSSAQEGR